MNKLHKYYSPLILRVLLLIVVITIVWQYSEPLRIFSFVAACCFMVIAIYFVIGRIAGKEKEFLYPVAAKYRRSWIGRYGDIVEIILGTAVIYATLFKAGLPFPLSLPLGIYFLWMSQRYIPVVRQIISQFR